MLGDLPPTLPPTPPPFQPAMVMPEPPAKPKGPPDYDAMFQQWQAAPATPQSNAQFLRDLDPLITSAAKTHVGEVNPLVKSRARQLTLQSLKTYDPNRGRLQNHVYSNLQRLKRYNAQTTAGVHVPERALLDRRTIDAMAQELSDKLGRDPTEDELADQSGFSIKRIRNVRQYSPAMTQGYFSTLGEGGEGHDPAVRGGQQASDAWEQLVFDDLDPIDRKIVEYDRAGHSNAEIARRLRRSPGLISQRKSKIQSILDQEAALSPF